jgi:uncharacterized protein (DUF2147 family)
MRHFLARTRAGFSVGERMHLRKLLVPLLALLFVGADAEKPDPICGVWFSEDRDAKLQIYQQGETFEAKIIWLKEPNRDGQPKVDANNPDPAVRSRPMLGLVILHDLRKSEAPKLYTSGRIYDPKNGKTYDCRVTFQGDTLTLRGFVLGLPMLGRSSTWTKAE